jgi:hypothetical protein
LADELHALGRQFLQPHRVGLNRRLRIIGLADGDLILLLECRQVRLGRLQLEGHGLGDLRPLVLGVGVSVGLRLVRSYQRLLGSLPRLSHLTGRLLHLLFELGPVGDHLGGLIPQFLIPSTGVGDCLLDLDLRVHHSLGGGTE